MPLYCAIYPPFGLHKVLSEKYSQYDRGMSARPLGGGYAPVSGYGTPPNRMIGVEPYWK